MEIKIVATTGKARGQAVEIRAVKFFIGRHENCQLRPDLSNLAGIHALIEQRDGSVHLRDFGGDGGTGINDRVIYNREVEVFDGDLIQVGPMVLTLSIKIRSEGRSGALREAPEGWPFLEGAETSPVEAKSEPSPIVPEPKLIPIADTVGPTRVNALLARELEPFAVTAASIAVPTPAFEATETSSASTATKASPIRPIIARPRALRAIKCEQVDDVMVVTVLSPELNEEETVSPVRYELRTLLDEEEVPERTVIDLGQTTFLSSRAVGVFLAHYQALERQGRAMRVCGVSKDIQPVIDQMRLSRLVDLFPTLEEAVETTWD